MSRVGPARARDTQAGFTLIETVIALAITAFLTTAAAGLVVQARYATEAVQAANTEAQRLLYLQTILRNDLDAIHNSVPAPEGNEITPVLSREVKLFTFRRDGWDNINGEAQRTSSVLVEYRFEGGALTRRVWLSEAPNSATPFAERVLYDNIADIKLNFRSGGTWRDNWPPFIYKIPKAVILRIDLESGERMTIMALAANGQ